MLKYFFGFFLFSFSAVSYAVEIDLLNKVLLDKKIYQLKDIAVIRGDKSNSLAGLNIGLSPRPGSKLLVSIDKIKAKLYQLKPELIDGIKWGQKSIVELTSKGKKLSENKIITLANSALIEWADHYGFIEYEFSLIKKPDAIFLPVYADKDAKFEVKPLMLDELKKVKSRLPIWVDVKLDGEVYHSFQVWYKLKAMQTVYMASVPLAEKTTLSDSILIEDVVDVTRVRGNPILSLDEISNKRLLNAVSKGDVLVSENLELVPLVSKGDAVEVKVRLGGVDITTKAIALKSGNYKETINVLNPVSNGSYLVTVIDQNKVMVK